MRRGSSWKKEVQSPQDKRKKGRKEEERASCVWSHVSGEAVQ